MAHNSAQINRLSKAVKTLRRKQIKGDKSPKTRNQIKLLMKKLKKLPIGPEEGGR